jgi:hypothetical protein|tara:strand:- start:169 stop:357 length:189 start_codon:yes stop_codon:yes gene_type:complete
MFSTTVQKFFFINFFLQLQYMRNKWLLQIQKTLHKYPGKPINQVLQIAKINYEKERKKKKKK